MEAKANQMQLSANKLPRHDEAFCLKQVRTEPFTKEIRETRLSLGQKLPKFKRYYPKDDPKAHLAEFRNTIRPYIVSEEILCQAFLSSLAQEALDWFYTLPSESISCFDELEQSFINHFLSADNQPKTVDTLWALRQGPNESLKDYMARYKQTFHQVPHCHADYAASHFKHSLYQREDVVEYLMKENPLDMKELSAVMDVRIKIEERRKQLPEEKGKKGAADGSSRKQVNNVQKDNGKDGVHRTYLPDAQNNWKRGILQMAEG